MAPPARVPTTFAKNCDRLIESDIARALFEAVVAQGGAIRLLSNEHFTVDGSLMQAWASHGSFQRTDTPPSPGGGPNATVEFRVARRANAPPASTTDFDARVARKGLGQTSRLAYHPPVLLDNRYRRVPQVCATPATDTAEVEVAELPIGTVVQPRSTVGTRKRYQRGFAQTLRA